MAETDKYDTFPEHTATKANPVVGAIYESGDIYCRHCMYRLELSWDGIKVITKNRAKAYVYNCKACGHELTKSRMYKWL